MARRSNCNHQEGHIVREDGSRVAVAGHDCDYVDARNALIPQAEKMADAATRTELKDPPPDLRRTQTWSRQFLKAMDTLAQRELQVGATSA